MPSNQFHRVEQLVGENEQWIAPTLTNSWSNVAGQQPAGYYKDKFNVVHLKGALDTGSSGTSAFTLPVGYRPSVVTYLPILQSAAAAGAFLTVNTNGTVVPTKTGAAVYLDNVSWRV